MTTGVDDLKPGSYDGEPDVFVLRDLLQYSQTVAEAEAHIQSVRRTWGMWVGLGDYATQQMHIVGYQQVRGRQASIPVICTLIFIDCFITLSLHIH